MPNLTKTALYERLRNDITAGGGNSLVLSNRPSPLDLLITLDGQAEPVRVYIWNLTHDRTRDDFKFQITGVPGGAFEFDHDTRTVVLGYHEPTHLYLAADAYHRRGTLSKSPAIQTRQTQLDAGYRDGIHAFKKANTGEIAIVVRDDLMATYLVEAESMHDIGSSTGGLARLNRIATVIGAAIVAPLSLKPRSKRESQVLRIIRDRNFAKRVLPAYDFQCCVCRVQLDLPQAAHIVPAGAALSSDDVRNGLALCPLHHVAYDGGLIGIMPNYDVRISTLRTTRLAAASRAGGLRDFKRGLRPKIILPFDRSERPDQSLLRLGLRARQWA